ncbi:MAG: nicotinate-nicotinamide nucleotide adenylyltransferase [Gemmatimonadota bacterium]|nr:nicotinate-nicotinamide nucleotide adenylyltransferase [Gemmatimonadota bacterium]
MRVDPRKLQELQCFMEALEPGGPPRAAFLRRAAKGLDRSGGNLVVMDASFNPMTVAHEAMLKRAAETCGAAEALLLLSHANVDKAIYGAPLAQRLAMLEHYAGPYPNVSVAGCSHARFVDKASALRPLYPKSTGLFFVVGYDTLLRLFDRRYYTNMPNELSALFDVAHIVAANRDNIDPNAIRRLKTGSEYAAFADRIHFIALERVYSRISSTAVRTLKEKGNYIGHLVPSRIADAIAALDLYRA